MTSNIKKFRCKTLFDKVVRRLNNNGLSWHFKHRFGNDIYVWDGNDWAYLTGNPLKFTSGLSYWDARWDSIQTVLHDPRPTEERFAVDERKSTTKQQKDYDAFGTFYELMLERDYTTAVTLNDDVLSVVRGFLTSP
jgi:hypothetical protein